MSLSACARLGAYEISALIGAGGMGEVYRARDTRLKRDVAVKILPQAVAADADRLARFQREAEVLAALNHPHIAAIYGLEENHGTRALVMELVEGETLDERIRRPEGLRLPGDGSGRPSGLPIDEALRIATQIAEALEAAHEQGIIHRDLKPANIKVRPDGTVKVLDFGLAKLSESPGSGQPGTGAASMSPTITSPALMTGVGVLLGTAAYMSPEQAKGKPADKRSDIWAFGCVLYEMLTGKRTFEGDDVADTLANVLKAQPDWTALPRDLPPTMAALLEQCLRKDRHQRIGDIAAALFALRAPGDARPMQAAVRPRLRRLMLPVAVTAIVSVFIAAAVAWRFKPATPIPLTRFELMLPDGEQFAASAASRRLIALSPDASHLAYVTNTGLYVRGLATGDVTRLVSATNQQGIQNPAFSPDGRSIAFYSVGDRTLKRVAVTGGAAATLASTEAPSGLAWGQDGVVFAVIGGVKRVSPDGGAPETVIEAPANEVIVQPQTLPGAKAMLFTLASSIGPLDFDRARIVVQSPGSGERKVLIDGGSFAQYLPTGHLVYSLGGVLWAVPFDISRLQVTGGPVSMIEGVARGVGAIGLGTSQFSVSENGLLAYIPGPAASAAQRTLVSVDGQGHSQPLKLPPGSYSAPRVSPDGSRLAVVTDDEKDTTIWIYDLAGTNSMRRLTFEGRNRFPTWSPDGQRIIFQSNREGDLGIWWQPADGSGPAERLTRPDGKEAHIPEASIPGRQLFSFSVLKSPTDASLWTFSLTDRKAEPFGDVRSSAPLDSAVSPDGRWMAYTVRGDGRALVYAQPIPSTGAKYQVSDQGHHPLWSPDGKQLQYFPGADTLVARRVVTQPAFAVRDAEPVLGGFVSNTSRDSGRNHDVTPDGRIIVALTASQIPGATAAAHVEVVLNWFQELKARVPTD